MRRWIFHAYNFVAKKMEFDVATRLAVIQYKRAFNNVNRVYVSETLRNKRVRQHIVTTYPVLTKQHGIF
jgi:hypothetical protein